MLSNYITDFERGETRKEEQNFALVVFQVSQILVFKDI